MLYTCLSCNSGKCAIIIFNFLPHDSDRFNIVILYCLSCDNDKCGVKFSYLPCDSV